MNESVVSTNGLLIVALLACLPLVFEYRRYLRVSFPTALGFLLAAMAVGALVTMQHLEQISPLFQRRDRFDQIMVPVASLGFYLLLVPFAIRLVRAWLFDDLTEDERRGGVEGVRGWLRGGNLLCAVGIPLTGWYAYGYSPWALLLLVLTALVARPVLAGSTAGGDGGVSELPQTDESLKNERERVLRLLEEGAIKPDEASELLSALTAPSSGAQHQAGASSVNSQMTPRQRLAFVGALLLIVGFVMPWYSMNLGEELEHAAGKLNQSFGDLFPGGMPRNFSLPSVPSLRTGNVSFSGADIQQGLGWLVLLCGAVAAFMVAVPSLIRERSLHRMLVLGFLGLGAILLLYLIGSRLRLVSYGMLVMIAAYACIGIGAADVLSRRRNATL